jgi:hypothetical protein
MDTRRDTSDTTVWCAFTDPKSGREYFHGPGGETTWVLPTTHIIDRAENIAQRSTMEDDKASNNGDGVRGRSKPADATVKQSRIWSSMGVAIAVFFILNTLFLLVLVKVIVNENVGKNHASSVGGVQILAKEVILEAGPTHASALDGSSLTSTHLELGNGSHCNEKIRDAADSAKDPSIPTMGPGAPPAECFSPEDGIGAKAVVTNGGEGSLFASKDVINNKQIAHEEYDHQEKCNEGDICKKATHVREPDVPPRKCWIPFSYILVGMCRQHARRGLLMPLADAESLLLI